MPRGGKRLPSGRTIGSKNRSTIQKELIAAEIAARTVADARASGKKLAKEVLDEFMHLFAGMAAHYQPLPEGQAIPPGRVPHEGKFLEYAKLARDTAAKLAPYQSPTFTAVQITAVGDVAPARPGDDAKVIDLKDQKVLQRTYVAMVKNG